ncbi:Uncharacterised protein [Chlamydia abortus]|nr:Uncharacterised protein [Chlamydia abortus]
MDLHYTNHACRVCQAVFFKPFDYCVICVFTSYPLFFYLLCFVLLLCVLAESFCTKDRSARGFLNSRDYLDHVSKGVLLFAGVLI